MKMNAIKCLLCGNDNREYFLEAEDRLNPGTKYIYKRCVACNLVTLDERESNQEFYAYNLDVRLSRAQRLVLWMIYRIIRRYKPGGRLLDFGCGAGNLAKYLKEKGYDVDCLDIDAQSIAWVKEIHKLTVTSQMPDKQYDVIILNSVFEHLPNPLQELGKITGHLAEDGIILIAIQNINSLQARIFGDKWFHLDAPRHLTQFYKNSFETIVNRCGLKIVKSYYFNLNLDPTGWYWSLIRPGKGEKIDLFTMTVLISFVPLIALTSLLRSTGQITYILEHRTKHGDQGSSAADCLKP